MPEDPWGSLAHFAGGRFGLFRRADAHRRGLTDRQIGLARERGEVEQLARHVFRFCAAPVDWNQSVLAACWTAGEEACASHTTAAALHGFDGFASGGSVEIVVPRGRRNAHVDAVVHSTTYLPPADRTRVGAIPVTGHERTLSDIGAAVPAERVEETLDGAERDAQVGRARVIARHDDFRRRGRNGCGVLASVLERREVLLGLPHSVLERRLLRVLDRYGLPVPVCQCVVVRPDGRRARLDGAYPEFLVGIETNGHAFHATRGQRADDHERSNQVGLRGWLLLQFTYEDVMRREVYVAHTVRRALRSRGWRA